MGNLERHNNYYQSPLCSVDILCELLLSNVAPTSFMWLSLPLLRQA